MVYFLGNFTVIVEENYDLMSEKAAELIANVINEKKEVNLGFATGGTPIGTYKSLIKAYNKNKIDFSCVKSFNLDEYYPIEKTNKQSYDYFMKENLFNHININFQNLYIPNGETKNPLEECEYYEKQIKEAGGIDFQLLGIGLNGHIGFNEPEENFAKTTQCVDLTESTINANVRYFNSIEEVPKKAISMGIKTIMMAKKILLIANGVNKANIIKETIFGNINPAIPATALQLHQNVTIVLDKEAASEILLLLNRK